MTSEKLLNRDVFVAIKLRIGKTLSLFYILLICVYRPKPVNQICCVHLFCFLKTFFFIHSKDVVLFFIFQLTEYPCNYTYDHYLPPYGILKIPIYLVWACWVQNPGLPSYATTVTLNSNFNKR